MKTLLAICGCVLALGFAGVSTSKAQCGYGGYGGYGGGRLSVNFGGFFPSYGYGYADPYCNSGYGYGGGGYGYGGRYTAYSRPVYYATTGSYYRRGHRYARRYSHYHRRYYDRD